MEAAEYRERTIQMINRYLNHEGTAREASDWALKIITSKDFEQLPPDITEAVQCLCDLHDIDIPDASWVPERNKFIELKTGLENNR
ncbi:MAG: hypothetical protein PVH77_01825 [Phycisphaerales bacterium]